MVRLSALYAAMPEAQFDHDYYEREHRNLVHERLTPFGLVRIEMERGLSGFGDAPAPFVAVGHLYFSSASDLSAGFAQHGQEIIADLQNFTNIQPLVQIGSVT
jgi:uncharacterized protein (TIGR02118 family)